MLEKGVACVRVDGDDERGKGFALTTTTMRRPRQDDKNEYKRLDPPKKDSKKTLDARGGKEKMYVALFNLCVSKCARRQRIRRMRREHLWRYVAP